MIGKFKMAALIGAAVAFVGHWVLHFAVAGALFAAIGLSGGGHSPAEAGPDCSNNQTNQTIYAKALTDHGCDSSEWHFVINQIQLGVYWDLDEYAPDSIHVTWANGNTERVYLEKYTGKTAHYTTYSNLDSTVTQAVAYIYSGWDGQFNLSHGPCVFATPTPTPTLTPTPTPTLTPSPTPPSGTPTPTPTPAPTPTVVPSPTPTPPLNPTPAPDGTATPDGTPTPVGTSVDQAPAPVGFPDSGGRPGDVKDFGTGTRVALSIIVVGLAIMGGGIVLSRLR